MTWKQLRVSWPHLKLVASVEGSTVEATAHYGAYFDHGVDSAEGPVSCSPLVLAIFFPKADRPL